MRWLTGMAASAPDSPQQLVVSALGRSEGVLAGVEVSRRFDTSTAAEAAAAGSTDVEGDLEQPRELRFRDDAALEAAERIEERRLHGVFCVVVVAELIDAEAEDPLPVRLEKLTCRVRGERLGLCREHRHRIPTSGPGQPRRYPWPWPHAELAQKGERRLRFDAFRDDRRTDLFAVGDQPRDERARGGVCLHLLRQTPVELDDVRREPQDVRDVANPLPTSSTAIRTPLRRNRSMLSLSNP